MTRPLLGLLAGAWLAACSPGPSSPPASSPPPAVLPAGLAADHPLLIVDEGGGLPGFRTVDVPRRLTLTADGTLITADLTGPGIVPRMTQTRLSPEELAAAWADVLAAGLAREAELPLPGLFDASTTTIGVDDGTRRTRLSIYALGAEGDGPAAATDAGISNEDVDARRRARAVLDSLRARDPQTEPYLAPAAVLLVGPAMTDADFDRAIDWTPPVDLATAGRALDQPTWARCAELAGDQAKAVLELATQLPPFVGVRQGASVYQVAVRPVMPDEAGRVGCDTVAGG